MCFSSHTEKKKSAKVFHLKTSLDKDIFLKFQLISIQGRNKICEGKEITNFRYSYIILCMHALKFLLRSKRNSMELMN